MNTQKDRLFAVLLKEWKELFRSKRAAAPALLLIAAFVFTPFSLLYAFGLASAQGPLNPTSLASYRLVRDAVLWTSLPAVAFLLSPIASDSFAGEKERKTIESLLVAPLSLSTLYLGKILPMVLLAVAAEVSPSLIGVALLGGVNESLVGPELLIFYFAVLPLTTVAAVQEMTTISFLSRSTKEAQTYSSFLAIPFALISLYFLLQQTSLTVPLLTILSFALVAGNLIIFLLSRRLFSAERLVVQS